MKYTSKRALGCGCAILILLPVLAVLGAVLMLIIPPVIDDIAAARFCRQAEKALVLPDGAEIFDRRYICANTSGTGNHVEMAAIFLVDSPNPIDGDELSSASGLRFNVLPFDGSTDDASLMRRMGIDLTRSEAENRYLVTAYKTAPLSFVDIRGH